MAALSPCARHWDEHGAQNMTAPPVPAVESAHSLLVNKRVTVLFA